MAIELLDTLVFETGVPSVGPTVGDFLDIGLFCWVFYTPVVF